MRSRISHPREKGDICQKRPVSHRLWQRLGRSHRVNGAADLRRWDITGSTSDTLPTPHVPRDLFQRVVLPDPPRPHDQQALRELSCRSRADRGEGKSTEGPTQLATSTDLLTSTEAISLLGTSAIGSPLPVRPASPPSKPAPMSSSTPTRRPLSLFDSHYPADRACVSSPARRTETLQQHEDACDERRTAF